jgi:hypothetical protein
MRFDLVAAIKYIVESAANDDVFIERSLRDEIRICLDGEGELALRFAVRGDFKERHLALECSCHDANAFHSSKQTRTKKGRLAASLRG